MQLCGTSCEEAYASPAGELSIAVDRLSQDLQSSFELLAGRLETVRREVTRNLKLQAENNRETVGATPRLVEAQPFISEEGPVGPVGQVLKPASSEREIQGLPEALVEWHTQCKDQDKVSGARIANARSSNFILAQEAEIQTHVAWVELGTKTEQLLEDIMDQRQTLRTSAFSAVSGLYFRNRRRSIIDEFDSHCFQPWHPHSPGRLAWDAGGVVLMLVDMITLPIIIAWGLDFDTSTPGSTALFLLFWLSLTFWSADIAIQFNTGIYVHGKLVLNRITIGKKYIKSWFLLDLLIVLLDATIGAFSLDVDMSSSEGMSGPTRALRSTRVSRILRTIRLLRLVRVSHVSRLNSVIEAVAEGKQGFILMSAIIKASLMVLLILHLLACAWFFAGRMVTETDDDMNSWIELADAGSASGITQYLHAVQWIVTPPAPVPVDPRSTWERAFHLLINGICLVILGSTLGYISDVLGQLRAVHSESRTKLLQVRKYLFLHRVPMELSARIVRFAEHRLQKAEAGQAIDLSLLTPTLQRELWASQRRQFIMTHPFFSLTFEAFPEIFASICGAARAQPYEENEVVFVEGENAVSMIITATGLWRVTCNGRDMEEFSEVTWFSEAAIYAKVLVLTSTLTALTFGDALHIGRDDLIRCVLASPKCTKSYCEYARMFIKQLQQGASVDFDDREVSPAFSLERKSFEEECSRKATHLNSLYQELHPDPKQLLDNLVADDEHDDAGKTANDMGHFTLALDPDEYNEGEDGGNNADWVHQVLSNAVSAEELPALLQEKIPELHPGRGIHKQLQQPVERDRSESACLSVLALVMNDYVI
eukprot:TRINITY_DN12997_c0_g1_i10.p1 TRINITY_DN12997_c0_g1~~TRINITY_DN12997_c0_g1_i10.p1  ORF type:complete len:824 (+),score=118.70 TRINITY_DN12997_c0_g1_i10:2-2473(+)